MEASSPLAVIFGCEGVEFSENELILFKDVNPLGLILFDRNCINPNQVLALTNRFREVVGRKNAPILIDQEGGRVTRLKPPHWRHPPPASIFVELAERKGDDKAIQAAYLNYRLVAEDLRHLGINVDCTPVLDMPIDGADPVIGDRALGKESDRVIKIGTAICAALEAGNVLPVIKHIPGHGRAQIDSHKGLPVVDATLAELEASDFEPFKQLNNTPLAMTAHIIYKEIDKINPATVSSKVIQEIIRGYIEFDGLLISDDISMDALSGDLHERTAAALAAGCDIVLHCNGKLDEMTSVAAGAAPMTGEALDRWKATCNFPAIGEPLETNKALDHLTSLLNF